MCFEGITQIILAMGYTNVDESFFKYEGDALWTLKAGIKIIKAELEPIELKYMSQEERTKYLLIKQNKEEYAYKMKEEKKRTDEAKRIAEYDRKIKNGEKMETL